MGQFTPIHTEGHINQALAGVLGQILDQGIASAVLVPCQQPHRRAVMQTLVRDPAALGAIDPFAPVVPTNSARLVAALTHNNDAPVAAVLRSCEVRAFLELVKLHQGSTDNLLLIGTDCFGRFESRDYLSLAAMHEDITTRFLLSVASGAGGSDVGADLAKACRMCEHPVADQVDIRICAIGADPSKDVWLEWVSDKGKQTQETLGLAAQDKGPTGRDAAVSKLCEERIAFRDAELAAIREKTGDVAGLSDIVAACINCYNCRVACPVCYCKECVFVTDTFRHDGEQYLRWASTRGRLKMPTDTTFYHLTRMLHMSTLCVGCGQCSSACPNDIPVMELFRSVADRTQARFAYVPGRSLGEKQPLAVFHAEEFDDVTGQVK
ncbi:MAG: formate dehydrogenase [Deltaproteobacteria bacterium HGW-Deltaproteobacteria-20]|jgi:formate dehydrogenase subunit beta|nr:MAG: formate dehydrogenase [Deltaproteobacteria bacterium HGW-Deltaproteobacteria-20]